jgi:hypothetical protein
MPYKTKAEQQRENWMTLPEVATHVQSVKDLNESEARDEVLKALMDDAFHSRGQTFLRWKEGIRILGPAPEEIGPHDYPPRGRKWAVTEIRWDTGELLDPYGGARDGKWQPTWRIVWLAKSKVIKIWPEPPPGLDAPPAASASANVVLLAGHKPGPKTKKKLSMVEAMRTDVVEKRLTAEQLRDMSDDELCSKYGDKVGAQRTSCRDARGQVLTEFDGINSVK